MVDFVYTRAKFLHHQRMHNLIAQAGGGLTLQLLLLMTNTSADTEEDTTTVAGFTTLDECDGAGYTRLTIAGSAVTENTVANISEWIFTAANWASLGVGTRQNQAALLIEFNTNDADSIPWYYFDRGGFPFDGNGGPVTFTPPAGGIVNLDHVPI